MPRGRSADAGSKTSVATYSTTHASVTAFVKFHERKICRSGPANPHMPGLRRPQTRHTGAAACVSLPQEGQRIDPVVLRNIAEGTVRVALPRRGGATGRAGHRVLGLPGQS